MADIRQPLGGDLEERSWLGSLRARANLLHALLRPREIASPPDFDFSPADASRVLDFRLDIPVRSYLNQALPLSIVSVGAGHWECLYGSFVQIFFPDDKQAFDRVMMIPGLGFSEWEQAGFLAICNVDTNQKRWRDSSSLLEFFVQSLERGQYLEIHVDEYYLPGRPCHGKIHSVHDNMIVGYKAGGKRFTIAGYGADYELIEVEYNDLLAAFYQMPKSQLYRRRVRTVEPAGTGKYSTFDVYNVRQQLRQYLTSTASISASEMRRSPPYPQARRFDGNWGVSCYTALDAYFRRSAAEGAELDLRVTRTFWEHKICMLGRLRRMEDSGILDRRYGLATAYETVEKLARVLRFSAFEYNVSGRSESEGRSLADAGEKLKSAEVPVLQQASEMLEKLG